VRPYERLTDRGRLARLQRLGADALVAFAIASPPARLTVIGKSFNTVFRVDGHDHDRTWALRVSPQVRIHTPGTEDAEARWIDALRRDGIASPPPVVRTIDGAPVALVQRPGVPGARLCTLMGWALGRPLSDTMSVERAADMGRLAASFHTHTATASPVGSADVIAADRVLYWRLDDRVSSVTGFGSVFVDALDRASRSVQAVWNDPARVRQLVHGDFTPSNVLSDAEGITPIDFQDLMWAIDVQDLAITRSSYLRLDDAEGLWAGFRTGYEQVRSWPSIDPEAWRGLVAARRLHVLNLALALRNPGLDEYVARAAEFMRAWMSR
jgi:Ser/Thr protein kinase RdoA (MazF antagonist)